MRGDGRYHQRSKPAAGPITARGKDGDGPDALAAVGTVSRETVKRLTIYVELLKRWQPAQNLVAHSTLQEIWHRHVADSAQVHLALPEARQWVDFGSGAGFPGLVTAIFLAEQAGADKPSAMVHLIESNQKKTAFLRAVIRETGCPAQVHSGRIEEIVSAWTEPVEGVSARALAPLTDLCGFAEGFVSRGATAIFHKGKNFQEEIELASHAWDLNLLERKSLIDPDSRLLVISRITARPTTGKG